MRKAAYLLALALSGCAVETARVVKLSTPAAPGTLRVSEGSQTVLVSGQGEIRLNGTRDHVITVEAPGYRPASVALTSHVSVGAVLQSLMVAVSIAPIGLPVFFVLASQGAFDVLDPANPWIPLVRDADGE